MAAPILFGVVALGGTVALIYVIANDVTGIGTADDVAAAPIFKLIWDNGSKVFA